MQGHVTDQQTLLSQALKRRAAERASILLALPESPEVHGCNCTPKPCNAGWTMAIRPTWPGWRPPTSRSPASLDGVNSVLAVGLNYYVDAQPSTGSLKVARYGWGRDYHRIVDQRLRRIGRWLSEQRPDCGWRACVDATPLLDKAWAEEAGLGWIGKHSNLIHPERGSWMVIGHLLTTESLDATRLSASVDAAPPASMPAPRKRFGNPLWWTQDAASPFTRSKTVPRIYPSASSCPWAMGGRM